MKYIFNVIILGLFVSPPKVGQIWVSGEEMGNPFLDRSEYKKVLEVKNNFVRYNWGNVEMSDNIWSFKWINTLVKDV